MAGDMDALRELIAKVKEGWEVQCWSNQPNEARGEIHTITRVFEAPDQTYRHEGETKLIRAGGPAYFSEYKGKQFRYQFPVEGEDFEVEGLVLRIYRDSYSGRNNSHTFTYIEPKEEV
jgi:hypothetical protein